MKRIITFMALSVAALAAAVSSSAAEPGCNAQPSCGAAECGDQGFCCPKCGCHEGMIPVCHNYCEKKKETKYRYYCKCEEICMPSGHGKYCDCGCDNCAGGCNGGGGCNEGCGGEENCHCHLWKSTQLVKYKYTVETPVKKCKVEWVCPQCGCPCGTTEGPAPAPSGAPIAPPAGPTPPPPPAPKSAQNGAANPISHWAAAILGNHSDEGSGK